VIASQSASIPADFFSADRSVIDILLMRFFDALESFILDHLQASVTTVAVQFKEIGIAPIVKPGSAFCGDEAGMQPTTWADAFLIQAPPLETIFDPSTEVNNALTMV